MKFKIGKEKIKISHNESNKFWKPFGMFTNISEIKINGNWCKCSLKFIEKDFKKYIQVISPMIVDQTTGTINSVIQNGIYKELPINSFYSAFIKILLNTHEMNYSLYSFKKTLYSRMNTIIIFSFAILLSILFFFFNYFKWFDLINFIATNIWCQTIIIFLTIASFINIFYPFAIRKELNEKDIENISKNTIENGKKDDEVMKRIKKQATF